MRQPQDIGFVYRFYGLDPRPAYIGSTNDIQRRMKQSRQARLQSTKVVIETYPTLWLAREAEADAIRREVPTGNKQHNPRRWHEDILPTHWSSPEESIPPHVVPEVLPGGARRYRHDGRVITVANPLQGDWAALGRALRESAA